MVIFGLFNRDDVPFRDVYIHPVIQDGNGKRMSKSAGNGVDPVDIIEIYGADALRYTLAAGATETQDLRIPVEKLKLPDGRPINTSERFEQGRNFANKFWNAARFALDEPGGLRAGRGGPRRPADRGSLDPRRPGSHDRGRDDRPERISGSPRPPARLRDFTWGEFCDWYVEFAKGRLRDPETRPTAQRVLAALLDGLCRLLHPIMPFVTEQVWQGLASVAPTRGLPSPRAAEESVCIAAWPAPLGWSDEAARETVERGARPSRRSATSAPSGTSPRTPGSRRSSCRPARWPKGSARGSDTSGSLSPAESVTIVDTAVERPAECAVAVLPDAEIILPLAGLIDKEAELAKHRKTLADLEKQIGGHRSKLANESFVARAPAEVVEQTRTKLAELEAQREAVLSLVGGR